MLKVYIHWDINQKPIPLQRDFLFCLNCFSVWLLFARISMIQMCVTRFSRRIPDSKLLYRRIPLDSAKNLKFQALNGLTDLPMP